MISPFFESGTLNNFLSIYTEKMIYVGFAYFIFLDSLYQVNQMMKRYLHVTFTCSNTRLGQLSRPHSPFLSFNRTQIAYNFAFSKSCLLDFTQSCVFSDMILPSTIHAGLRWQIFSMRNPGFYFLCC